MMKHISSLSEARPRVRRPPPQYQPKEFPALSGRQAPRLSCSSSRTSWFRGLRTDPRHAIPSRCLDARRWLPARLLVTTSLSPQARERQGEMPENSPPRPAPHCRIQRTASTRFGAVQMQKHLTNVVSAYRTGSRTGAARQSEPLTRCEKPRHWQVWAGDGSWSPAPEPVRRRGLARIRSSEFALASFMSQREHPASYR